MNLQILPSQFTSTAGYLNIIANASGKIILKVLDLQGRITKTIIEKAEQGIYQLSINLSDLKNGIYVLNAFCSEGFIKAIKFVKN